MIFLGNLAITLATTLISADRIDETDQAARNAASGAKAEAANGQALYSRGKSEFAQTLEKVETPQQAIEVLDKIGKLATPDTSVDTLIRASAQPDVETPQPHSLAELNKSIQAGGERLRQATRLGAHLSTVS